MLPAPGRSRFEVIAIREQEIRQAQAAVEFLLSSNRDYARTNDNRDQMLRWLKDHNLPITPNSLLDYSDLGPTNHMRERPAKQHVELVEQKAVKKITMADVRKMSTQQYEAALKDTDLSPQIEALLADQ